MAIIPVHNGDNLQTAFDIANAGDTLMLDYWARFDGRFTLSAKSSPGVTVTSSATLPNRRIGPADAGLLPILAPSGGGVPALDGSKTGAANWRFDGIQVLPTSAGGSTPMAFWEATNITLDRLLFVGGVDGQKRGILGNGNGITVNRSYIANCWASGQDSQAFCAFEGSGPYILTDNFLEAASENILFGGSDCVSDATIPADILIEGNDCSKQFAWVGTGKNVKNLFELKCCRRVTVRGNTFDGNWGDAQAGYAILFNPRNQDGGAPWSTVEDVLFERNLITNTLNGFNILGSDYTHPSGQLTRLTIRHNLLQTLDWGYGFLITGGGMSLNTPAGVVTIDHNTINHEGTANEGNILIYFTSVLPAVEDFTFTNNLCDSGQYGIKSDNAPTAGTAALAEGCVSYTFLNNVVAGAGNTYPATTQIPDLATYHSQFVDYGTDYTLVPGSAYHDAGTDGLDLGVVWDAPIVPPLPSPWVGQDIGTTGLSGSATDDAGLFTAIGAGADIWGTSDAFHYVSQPVTGDCQIQARLDTIQNTHAAAKAGVMWRSSAAANSAFVLLSSTPAGGIEFYTRQTDGAAIGQWVPAISTVPVWVRLRRVGNIVSGAYSSDGVTWTAMTETFPVTFPSSGLVGLAVCSHDTGALNTSTFDQVSVSLYPPWAHADIGTVGLEGSAVLVGSTWTIAGAGADVWGVEDAFRYVWQPWSGDFTVTTRVLSLQNTNDRAKAGLMVRASTAVDAAHVLLTPWPDGTLEFMVRTLTGGQTGWVTLAVPGIGVPVTLRLSRLGSTITGSYQVTGTAWTMMGTLETPVPSACLIGLAVCSHDVSVLDTATFTLLLTDTPDLACSAVKSLSGRLLIMPPYPTLIVNLDVGERLRIAEALSRAITLLVGVSDEVLLLSANTVSKILDQAGVGEVAFVVGSDYATNVTSVTANIRVSGNSTVVATQGLGKPTPDGNHVCIVDLTTTFAGLAPGNYTVSILFTGPGGSTDSAESAAFAVPV